MQESEIQYMLDTQDFTPQVLWAHRQLGEWRGNADFDVENSHNDWIKEVPLDQAFDEAHPQTCLRDILPAQAKIEVNIPGGKPAEMTVVHEWRVFRSTVHTGADLLAFTDPLLLMYHAHWYGLAYLRISVVR